MTLTDLHSDVVCDGPLNTPGVVAHRRQMVKYETGKKLPYKRSDGTDEMETALAAWPACVDAPEPSAGRPRHYPEHSARWSAHRGAVECRDGRCFA